MKIKATVKLHLKTADGRTLYKRRFKSHSYVLAFLDILYAQFAAASPSIKDIYGTPRSVPFYAYNLYSMGIAGAIYAGIVVGIGTTQVLITDFQLASQITHGSAAGQLNYGAVSFIAPTTLANARKFSVIRSFTNLSGATITVKECGIYSYGSSIPYFFCTVRDLTPANIPVPNGSTLAVTYTIQVSA